MRRIATSAVLAALVAVTTACTIGGGSGAQAGPRPVVGQCRTYDSAAAAKPVEESAPVSCTSAHVAETFAVADVLPAPGDGGTWSEPQLVAAAKTLCGSGAHASWLGVGANTLESTRLSENFFGPSPQQAKAGARWIRCDAVAVSSAGQSSTVGSQRASTRIPGAFARCAKVPPAVPYTATICRAGDANYAAVSEVFLGDPRSAYPSAPATLVDRVCAATTRAHAKSRSPHWVGTTPTRAQWDAGVTYGLCWLPQDDWKVDAGRWPIETAPVPTVSI